MTLDGLLSRTVPLALLACALAAPAQQPPVNAAPFPLDQVHRGLHGTAWTVFEGTQPEAMDVEILGILKNAIGPRQDMILARLHGTHPEYTGVVAGMSGSPVYIDGKLLGALSYRIGQFSKEPIAGITPIQQMFEVRDTPSTTTDASLQPEHNAVENPAFGTTTDASFRPERSAVEKPASSAPNLQPIETPLIFNGFDQSTLTLFGDRFRALGLTPIAGLGASAPNQTQPEPILPGSAVSAILARGDISIAATCTVTYIDPTRLLACGHPITQYGPVSMPMTKADVVATLPSPLNAFKIVNTTQTIGSFTQDRSAAILGTFGSTARMIPVTVDLRPATAPPRALKFEVLDNRQLTPQVMIASIYQAISGTNLASGEMSLRLHGTLQLDRYPAVHLDQTLAPTDLGTAPLQAALYIFAAFNRVFANTIDQPTITAVNLTVDAIPTRLSSQIESARLSTDEANPGDQIFLDATLRPYQAAPRTLHIPIRLPATLDSGSIRILVSDAATLDRLLAPPPRSAEHPLGLADTVAQLNRTHPNDRIYVTILDHAAQAVLASTALPTLPLSMANVLQPLRDTQQLSLTSESAVEAASAPTQSALTGSQVLTLRIR